MGSSELLASTEKSALGTIPTTRQSALAFTEGVRGGWLASDLAVWIEDHLLQPNRLVLRKPGTVQVVEPRVGTVVLGRERPTSSAARAQSAVQVVSLLVAARDRIVRTLKASVDSDDARYIHAALYAGRVSRERGPDGRAEWCVYLTEDVPLSDQVLALFAADALTNPTDHTNELSVCEVCGAIEFSAAGGARRGCAIHPYGSYEAGPPPSSRSGARRVDRA